MANKEKYRSDNPLRRALLDRFLRRSKAVIGKESGAVLDVGSGEGLYWGVDAPRGLVAVDIRLEALLDGQSRIAAVPVVGSVLALPFPDDSFDLVTAIEVLEHLQDPARAVAEIRRVTRHRVVVSVPWEPFFSLATLAGSGRYLRRLGREPEHVQAFGPGEIRILLEEHFSLVRVGKCFPWILAEAKI